MSDRRSRGTLPSWELALALAYVVAIFVVGSLPGAPPVARSVSDKVQHAIGFGLLAWIWCAALKKRRPQDGPSRTALGGFLVSVGVGGLLELWQGLLTYRTCELLDWGADAAGALGAVLVYAAIQHRWGERARAAE